MGNLQKYFNAKALGLSVNNFFFSKTNEEQTILNLTRMLFRLSPEKRLDDDSFTGRKGLKL
jgi:hypothetical protein